MVGRKRDHPEGGEIPLTCGSRVPHAPKPQLSQTPPPHCPPPDIPQVTRQRKSAGQRVSVRVGGFRGCTGLPAAPVVRTSRSHRAQCGSRQGRWGGWSRVQVFDFLGRAAALLAPGAVRLLGDGERAYVTRVDPQLSRLS